MTPPITYDVVVPTTGRASLDALLASLASAGGPPPAQVLVVDDRPGRPRPLPVTVPPALGARSVLLRTGGRGPAAARNAGWRNGRSPWIVFLDDDVVLPDGWGIALLDDLRGLPWRVAGSQARVEVPLPAGRRPTDWERNVRGLQDARWITADMALRRAALEAVGGFDERFPRAYREDADLGLRLERHGLSIAAGHRTTLHPVPDAGRWVSVRKQAGNADDALMRAVHGRRWRQACGTPRGRLPRHVGTVVAGAGAVAGAATGHPKAAALAAGAWATATAGFARARIASGPRTRDELLTMTLTSAAIPPVAAAHRLRGELRARSLTRPGATDRATGARAPLGERPHVVLLDRDGTLVHDVPYNGDPALVEPIAGVAEGLDRLRAAGIRLAVVSNQSGIGRGLLTFEEVAAVTNRTVQLLGPVDHVAWCPHTAQDGCACRKPQPGMLLDAARALGADPLRCVMIGDIGADMQAARTAGMRGVLVPTSVTRRAEIRAAGETAGTFTEAVDRLLAAPPAVPLTPHPLGVPELHAVERVAVAR